MTSPSNAYERPTFTTERLEGEADWSIVCSLCGADVRHTGVHSAWHDALARAVASAPEEPA